MNDITNITTGTDIETDVAAKPVAIFDGKAYAISVFEPFKKQIARAKREAGKVEEYDITTGAGMGRAKELRAMFRDIRTTVENVRKERKAPIIDAGKLLDSRAAEIKAEIEPFEDKYDAQIKAEEARKAAEKARKEAEERARVEAIEARLAGIRSVPAQMASADSAAIRKQIDQWTLLRLDPADYQEYLEDALTSVNTTLDQLGVLLAGAEAREAEARRVMEERAELARLKAEQVEREAKAAQERAARDAAAQAERDAAAKREADAAAEMAALRAQLAEMQAAAARAAAAAKAAEAPEIVTPAPAAPAADAIVADIELDDTGLVVGQVVMKGGTVPTDDLQMGAIVQASPEAVRALDSAIESAEKSMRRPTDGELVEALCIHYGMGEDIVIGWLRDFSL
jgi:hypothetical protein